MGQNALQETQEGDVLLEEASTLFSASLWPPHYTDMHKYTLAHSPPLLLCYFYLGQYFSVKAAAAVWAEASPPHPERSGRE